MIAASWPQDLSGPIAFRFDVPMIGDWFKVKTARAASEARWSPWRDTNGTHRVHTFSELQGALA